MMAETLYDVLIVGSGHTGGMAAHMLTSKGISCLMLNAGPVADLSRDRRSMPGHELPYRGLRLLGAPRNPPVEEYQLNTFVDTNEVPYTHDPDKPFVWVRSRLVGGRSLTWSRNCHRLSDFEFKQKDHEDFGENWPLSHDELAPHYEHVETLFRVVGRPEGLPQWPDSKFTEIESAPESSEVMARFQAATAKRDIRVSGRRQALGINGLTTSVNVLLPDAFASGKLTLVPDAVVRELSVDSNTGLVNGAYFVHRQTRREMHAKARVVVLAAGSLESTRILLNSGIANSSGVLGHYVFDQVFGDVIYGFAPEALNGEATPELNGGSGFIPPFRNVGPGTWAPNFIGRYAVSVTSGVTPSDDVLGAYGEDLVKKRAMYANAGFSVSMLGEVVPRFENHVRLNKDVTDPWGISVLHASAQYGENEDNMQVDAQNVLEELMHECGIEVLLRSGARREFGQSTHELGTCRMGDDPKTSVLNKWNQAHDVKNLFVVDGSCFVTGGWQNPTLTMLALASRAAEYLAEELRQGSL